MIFFNPADVGGVHEACLSNFINEELGATTVVRSSVFQGYYLNGGEDGSYRMLEMVRNRLRLVFKWWLRLVFKLIELVKLVLSLLEFCATLVAFGSV